MKLWTLLLDSVNATYSSTAALQTEHCPRVMQGVCVCSTGSGLILFAALCSAPLCDKKGEGVEMIYISWPTL